MEQAVEIYVTSDSNFQTANCEIVDQRWLKTQAILKSYCQSVNRDLATHSHAHPEVLKSNTTFAWSNNLKLYYYTVK